MKKVDWFKQEKKNFLKEVPKKKISKDEFTPERALKLAGGVAFLGVGIHLAKEIVN